MNITQEQEPISQEEMAANYDAWWNSLSNEDKEKLFREQDEAEEHFNGLKG